MADNTNFVLRWKINNARAAYAAGVKVKSDVFNEGGFKWNAAFEKRQDNSRKGDFVLQCDANHNGSWECEVDVKISLVKSSGSKEGYDEKRISFLEDQKDVKVDWQYWYMLTESEYVIDDAVTVEFHIHVISSERTYSTLPNIFAATNNRSDVILKIGEKKLHVSKELLAIHSPVFEALFFGDFAEKGKAEVEIKDVDYEEFVGLLNVIYCEKIKITDFTVPHMLKLSDRFQMERIMKLSEKHLKKPTGFGRMKKLLFADQYRLASLKDLVLQSFTSVDELTSKLKSPDYASLSADMKASICDRIADLV